VREDCGWSAGFDGSSSDSGCSTIIDPICGPISFQTTRSRTPTTLTLRNRNSTLMPRQSATEPVHTLPDAALATYLYSDDGVPRTHLTFRYRQGRNPVGYMIVLLCGLCRSLWTEHARRKRIIPSAQEQSVRALASLFASVRVSLTEHVLIGDIVHGDVDLEVRDGAVQNLHETEQAGGGTGTGAGERCWQQKTDGRIPSESAGMCGLTF
jgi:hypothetical protein